MTACAGFTDGHGMNSNYINIGSDCISTFILIVTHKEEISMQDYYGGPIEDATDRYLADYGEAQESMEADENEVMAYCTTCCVCGRKILPRETALTIDVGDSWFHESHLEETSGEELATEHGCDYDTMHRYLEVTQ